MIILYVICMDKKYVFYKYIFIIFHNNIVIFNCNMFNFKIYLILKLWIILNNIK